MGIEAKTLEETDKEHTHIPYDLKAKYEDYIEGRKAEIKQVILKVQEEQRVPMNWINGEDSNKNDEYESFIGTITKTLEEKTERIYTEGILNGFYEGGMQASLKIGQNGIVTRIIDQKRIENAIKAQEVRKAEEQK